MLAGEICDGVRDFVSTPKPIEGGEAAVLAALSRAQAAPIAAAVAEADKAWTKLLALYKAALA